GRIHARADTAALRRCDLLLAALARLQAGRGELLLRCGTTLADQLAGGRHALSSVAGAAQTAAPGYCACRSARDEVVVDLVVLDLRRLRNTHRLRDRPDLVLREPLERVLVGPHVGDPDPLVRLRHPVEQ